MNHYIANLNSVPSPQEEVSPQEFGNLEEELALFTNTEFFLKDFDPSAAAAEGKAVGFDEGTSRCAVAPSCDRPCTRSSMGTGPCGRCCATTARSHGWRGRGQ